MTARRPAAGFSLVEVLVSMFIVALGILALAGVLQAATRHARMSEQRSAATLLANDIADRIRANPIGAALASQGYDQTGSGFPSALPATHAACTEAAPCGPTDLAQADLAAWTARLRATLPQGSAVIRFHAGAAPAVDVVDVWVGWSDPNAPAATNVANDRSGTECPAQWAGATAPVRCLYLAVAP
jgi:type IV pilus assembly protein PilV